MSLKATVVWQHRLTDKDDRATCVFDSAFNPDGTLLILAVGSSIEVYDPNDGKLINKLNAHKGNVHSLSYSRDGAFFASGSADKCVIIWTSQLEGHLKYSHGDGIQCVAYNPVSHQILSCAVSDIGLWSPEHRSVAKRKVPCQVCSCSWTNDGQYFALGMLNGTVTIWTKNGDEKFKIDRPSDSPVWCLSWNPLRDDHYNILSVCDWGRKLSFYQLNGKQIGKDHSLDFDPCFFSHSADGDFFMIGGSNRTICLYSKEGLKLGTLGNTFESWIWSCQSRPGGKYVVASGNDGTVVCYHIAFGTVHGLYKDRYAYRSGLTNVVVQHLLTDDKIKLKCRDLVKKVAIYKNKLAVQLSEKVIIYESSTDEESGDMTYIVKERIPRNLHCSLLVCCSENIVFCLDQKMLSLSMKGEVEREWEVESQIRYLKVLGGPSGNESMLAGLKNGQILKFFLNNPFPVELLKISSVVRCVDLSVRHTKLAIVDENNILMVYSMKEKELLYQEPDVSSVAWNTSFEDMLCYSRDGMLLIKADKFPPQQLKLQNGQGLVVGFIGSKIFSLQCFNMITTDVSQSSTMMQYLKKKMYHDSYKVACLGVTMSDWQKLAFTALEEMNFDIAKKGFARLRDIKYIELISDIEERISNGERNMSLYLGNIYASEKKFQQAEKMYLKANCSDQAVEMYIDLCEFDLAKKFMTDQKESHTEVNELINKEADWAKATNDPQKACNKYISAGEYSKAILLMVEHEWIEKLINLANTLPANERETLSLCAYHLNKFGESDFAASIYSKLEDYSSLVALYADRCQWDKGFDLISSKPELKDVLYLPYATYLMEKDRFEEAQEALREAGRQNEALDLLQKLCAIAVSMKKFHDAGYYNWLLAQANLVEAKNSSESDSVSHYVERFHWHIRASMIYYVYQHIHSFVNLPFTSQPSETMFNMASFIVHHLVEKTPPGISQISTYLTLAKHGINVKAYKTARYACEKLQSLLIPSELRDFINTSILTLKTKPLNDREDLLRFCYRCSTSNPVITMYGNFCSTCCQPFTYSFGSFEILPVVEFYLEDGISDEEAVALIKMEPLVKKTQEYSNSADVLQFDNDGSNDDPFLQKLLETNDGGSYSPITVDRSLLASMHWRSIIIKKWPPPLRYQYYCLLLSNVQIRLCSTCNQMFYSEDYELHVLCKGKCPFCRQPPKL